MISVSNRDLHWGKWQPLHYILHLPPALSHSSLAHICWLRTHDIYCSPVPRRPTNLQDKQTQHQHMRWEQGLHMCNKSSIVQHCYSSIKLSAVGKEQVELWNIQDCCCLQKALGSKLPVHQHGQTVHNWLKIINSAKDYIHVILVLHFQPDSWVFSDSSADSATENHSQDFIQLKASQNRKIHNVT